MYFWSSLSFLISKVELVFMVRSIVPGKPELWCGECMNVPLHLYTLFRHLKMFLVVTWCFYWCAEKYHEIVYVLS